MRTNIQACPADSASSHDRDNAHTPGREQEHCRETDCAGRVSRGEGAVFVFVMEHVSIDDYAMKTLRDIRARSRPAGDETGGVRDCACQEA